MTVLLLGLVGALVLVAAWYVVTQPMPGSVRRPEASPPADPRRLRESVEMLSRHLGPRDDRHPDNLDKVAAYVRERWEVAGAQVSDQRYPVGRSEYRNVIAAFGPAAGPRIVVGAHYDTAGPLPGADDNASGVAGLLELARLLGSGAPPPARVELVAYTLEEPPHFRTPSMGSWVHAEGLRRESVAVRAMLSLEMIGFFSDAPGSQRFPAPPLRLFYPSRGNFVAVVGRLSDIGLVRQVKAAMRSASDLDVRSMNGPAWVPGVDFSDHLSYWAHGFPAVMVTDTAFYRNDRYHTERDTPETLDYRRMAQVVEGVHAAVRALAR